MSLPADGGQTALHAASQAGHPAVAIELVKAGAKLEHKDSHGKTPLHMAADVGQCGVMLALIESGANVNCRGPDGATPLYSVAWSGHVDGINVLLHAKADPLLRRADAVSGISSGPLDAAVYNGHCEAARELVQQLGISMCGGPTGGMQALELAAETSRADIMGVLMDAGVVDTGMALVVAAELCREASVKFLLERHKRGNTRRGSGYVNHRSKSGRTALFNAIVSKRPSPRIARMLIDAGADGASPVRVLDTGGVLNTMTPLELTADMFKEKSKRETNDDAEERRNRLDAIRRLLLQLDAVHARSWLWAGDAAAVGAYAAGEGTRASGGTKTPTTSVPLVHMLPVLRRRASRSGVAVVPLVRWVRHGVSLLGVGTCWVTV